MTALVGDTKTKPSSSATPRSAGPDGPAAVEIRGLNKRFEGAGGAGVTALQDVSLTAERGTFVSLIGPSGCGKTTLLRIVAGLTAVTDGEVLVNGMTPDRARRERAYGMVFQAPTLFEWRSVSDNVRLPLEVFDSTRRERGRIVDEALELVGLTEFARSRVWELSGGMQQRVSIARALSFRPALLLMDEPFGALDEMTRERLNLELLRIQRETGTTVLFVTHSISEAVFLSDRIVVMSPRPGRITSDVRSTLASERDAATRQQPEFFELVNAVRSKLRGSGTEAA